MKHEWTTFLILTASLALSTNATHLDPEFLSLASLQGNSSSECDLDESKPPGDLTQCGNSTLFHVWRPKARFIAPAGWMNDPQGVFQREDGSFHMGYECNPNHVQWGNISQCSAHSKDLVYWHDMRTWEDTRTMSPSMIYDIKAVYDGSMIQKGWEGDPTQVYSSQYPVADPKHPVPRLGEETVSIAYTKDGGESWIKLRPGAGGNPIICKSNFINSQYNENPRWNLEILK